MSVHYIANSRRCRFKVSLYSDYISDGTQHVIFKALHDITSTYLKNVDVYQNLFVFGVLSPPIVVYYSLDHWLPFRYHVAIITVILEGGGNHKPVNQKRQSKRG